MKSPPESDTHQPAVEKFVFLGWFIGPQVGVYARKLVCGTPGGLLRAVDEDGMDKRAGSARKESAGLQARPSDLELRGNGGPHFPGGRGDVVRRRHCANDDDARSTGRENLADIRDVDAADREPRLGGRGGAGCVGAG